MTEGRGAWIIRRRRLSGDYGLKPCPRCGRLNGKLQRTRGHMCAIGVGCRKGGGHVMGRAE